jgi:hypothetical protein
MLRTSVEPFNFFRAQLPPEKIVSVLEHINEGCGVVRKTERLVGVHRDTITRYSRLAGEHDALRAHDDELLVAFPLQDQRSPVRREVLVCGQEGETP